MNPNSKTTIARTLQSTVVFNHENTLTLYFLSCRDLSRNCFNGSIPPQWATMRLVELYALQPPIFALHELLFQCFFNLFLANIYLFCLNAALSWGTSCPVPSQRSLPKSPPLKTCKLESIFTILVDMPSIALVRSG